MLFNILNRHIRDVDPDTGSASYISD